MGASGSGKTTLLNIIADRISLKNATLTGEILVNDASKLQNNNFGYISGYVMQDDILYQHFTPREALTFSADLKLSHLSEDEKN